MDKIEQLQKQIDELKKELTSLQTAQKQDKIIHFDDLDVTNGDVTVSTAIGSGGGTVNHFDFPDRWIVKKHGTKTYLIPAYNFTRL